MLIEVKNLHVEFQTLDGTVKAVNGVNFHVDEGEVLGIVGESGSGKSVATHAIMQLVPTPPGKITKGVINFKGTDLLSLTERDINKVCGKDIGMIFQEPMTSLNPVYTIENQIVEAYKLHFPKMSKAQYKKMAISALEAVGIPSPEKRLKAYPHELSGGMRQRVMIAIALACGPKLLIADEPTTALDVTIQAQILDILNNLCREKNLGVILITHDLAVIAETADKVAVMYAGRMVETASAADLFKTPSHPYTICLLNSIPAYNDTKSGKTKEELQTIPGMVPDLRYLPKGCAFSNRCSHATEECQKEIPPLEEVANSHFSACIYSKEIRNEQSS